jgi:hypothetical protein
LRKHLLVPLKFNNRLAHAHLGEEVLGIKHVGSLTLGSSRRSGSGADFQRIPFQPTKPASSSGLSQGLEAALGGSTKTEY